VIKKFFPLTLLLSKVLQKVDIDLSYYYKRVADICKISKKILDDGDKEFKETFSFQKHQ